MTHRVVAVLVPAPAAGEFPDERLRLAMVEDVYETVAGLELVAPALVLDVDDPSGDALEALTWPGTAVVRLARPGPGPRAAAALAALAAVDTDQVALVAGDAPDLPGLLVGKLHRALGSADVAVLPTVDGGLVALACPVPLPGWCGEHLDLDAATALATLRARAPRRTAVVVGPGWHRVRTPGDLDHLDPGLEGWDVTRAALSGR